MNIKAERLNRGLSVDAAAEAMGVAAHTVRTAERGIRPRPETAKKIADFYNGQVSDIWPVDEPTRSAA